MYCIKNFSQIRKIFENINLFNEIYKGTQEKGTNVEYKHIRNYIFDKVIALITEKHYIMYGPEKSITAKFIAENFKELIVILINAFNIINSKEDQKG
jgi:hypothetical protein